jgi:hypothetical protein
MDESLLQYTKSLLLPAAILTNIHFWSFIALTMVWICKIRKDTGALDTKLEVQTIFSIFCFAMVLLLELIFVNFELIVEF